MASMMYRLQQLLLIVTSYFMLISGSVMEDDPSFNSLLPYYFDYLPQEKLEQYGLNQMDYQNYIQLARSDFNEDISSYNPKLKFANSPVNYIRMPPPYMLVSGFEPHKSLFINVPIRFVANGKPSAISFKPSLVPQKSKPSYSDSNVHKIPSKYVFNGKPNDVFLLRDSYNYLYDDALQNVYP